MVTLDRRLQELEGRRIYMIASLADLVILTAWRHRGDPRLPAEEDIEWDPAFEDIYDSLVTKRGDKSEVDLAGGRKGGNEVHYP